MEGVFELILKFHQLPRKERFLLVLSLSFLGLVCGFTPYVVPKCGSLVSHLYQEINRGQKFGFLVLSNAISSADVRVVLVPIGYQGQRL